MAKSDAAQYRSGPAILAAVALALVIVGQMALAQAVEPSTMAASDAALRGDYEVYHHRCRGNSGDDPETWVACGARDYAGYLLNISGYCYGEIDQTEADMIWHLCTTKSNRFDKP